MVVRYHDAIPLLMPHTIKDRGYHRAAHYQALLRNARDGAWFACVSEATRQDLLSVMPQVAARAVTIPNMVSHHFFAETTPAEPRAGDRSGAARTGTAPHERRRRDRRKPTSPTARLPYLLMVCTIEPRKNHLTLLDAWEQLRSQGFDATCNLVFVGSLGWDHKAILHRCAPWLQRGGLHLLENVPSSDLRLLYRHAGRPSARASAKASTFPASRRCAAAASSRRPTSRCTAASSATPASTSAPYSVGRPRARAVRPDRRRTPGPAPGGPAWRRARGSPPSTCPSGSCRNGASSCATSSRHEPRAAGKRRIRRAWGRLRTGTPAPAPERDATSTPSEIERICETLFHRGTGTAARLGRAARCAHALARLVPPGPRSARRRPTPRSSTASGS